jgi:Ca-activated chloride channel family protein
MKFRYTRYTGEDLEGIDLEEIVSKLSRLLLSSGFDNPHGDPFGDEDGRPIQDLHDAILEALLGDGLLSDDTISRLLGDPADADQEAGESPLEHLIQQIIDQMTQDGYITTAPGESSQPGVGNANTETPPTRFEVTDKSLDFLGYRALRDLLGSVGKSSVGRHDTRDLSTGVEASGTSKPYEFGDTMNIDASGTILNAVSRTGEVGGGGPIDVQYSDLMVAQGEYQSSCATVLMLDCSHSMILYGEDRFTPAKQVALALANLIQHQYPGDALNVVLFHDSAEMVRFIATRSVSTRTSSERRSARSPTVGRRAS